MVATETDYLMAIKAMPPGTVLTLSDVCWEEYEELLEELDERPFYRLSYDNGRLEVMTVSPEHEIPAGLFPHLIGVLAEECDLDFLSLRSSTLRKKKRGRGIDPDDCYYFKEFKQVSGKKRIDLSVDPPPDLALEIDVTHGSIRKFPIYAAVGVPDLWRYRNGKMKFYRLADDEYDEIANSDLFPFLAPDVVCEFLQKGEAEGTVAMVKEFRKWVRTNKSSSEEA